MEIRTENLTILFVDIAGFTATTSRQSRAENAHLLQTFETTLLPLIKRFKGTVVKSIGDALLLTFRSPTDAMLCSMALQDAMHAHNLRVPDDQKIHIRVAANLGEVRVTKKDIFGEPVNVASRIEGVAPADEIYLSEAVYMAMNKAEVPAQEVGFKELAGIPQPVRVYSIPRFATHRLIPQNQLPPDQGNELLFPYGGMHQRAPERSSSMRLPDNLSRRLKPLLVSLVAIAGLATATVYFWSTEPGETVVADSSALPASAPPTTASTTSAAPTSGNEPAPLPVDKTAAPITEASTTQATVAVIEPAPAPGPVAQKAKPEPTPISTVSQPAPVDKAKPVEPAPSKTAVAEKAVVEKKSPTPSKAEPEWNVAKAKAAYRAGQLSKPEYRDIIQRLETVYENRIRELKLAYRAGQISETEYESRVRDAKLAYNGR